MLVVFIACISIAMAIDHRNFDLELYLSNVYGDTESDHKCQLESFYQRFHQNFLYAFYCICGMVVIPLYETLIFPVFNQCMKFRSHFVVLLGIVLQLGGYVALIILTTYSRKVLTDTDFLSNETILCIFHESSNSFKDTIDYKWYIIPEILFAFPKIYIIKGALEFYCAQVPYSMKGLLTGSSYGFVAIFASFNYGFLSVFKINFHIWEKKAMLSCEFWYLLTKIIPGIFILLLSILAFKCYKKGRREDILPNEHIFAEQYYSKTISLTT